MNDTNAYDIIFQTQIWASIVVTLFPNNVFDVPKQVVRNYWFIQGENKILTFFETSFLC